MNSRVKLYGYADVGPYGLTHSLLAWARCRLWCARHNIPMLAPSWFRLKGHIGPFLRREYDKRLYFRLFEFPGYVSGLQKYSILATSSFLSPDTLGDGYPADIIRQTVLLFKNTVTRNEELYFHQIRGSSELVLNELRNITKAKYLPHIDDTPHIAVHVRLGDFSQYTDSKALHEGCKNTSLPIDWYCDVLATLQNKLGRFKTVVYSDGSNDDLMPLLRMHDVVRSPRQPSITDLLSIAQAKLVVSSGSGFSTWGAYLANSPRICYPGQRFVRVLEPNNELDLEPEFEAQTDLSTDFLRYIHGRISYP